MNRFEGKVAIVSGAANGIGRAIADRLAAEGAAIGLLKAALPGGLSPGKGAFFVAKQFRFNQVSRNSRHIQCNKGVGRSRTMTV